MQQLNTSKTKLSDNSKQLQIMKWGYRNMKYVQSRTEQLQMKFIEKINSAKMQLQIAMGISENINKNNKKDCIVQVHNVQINESPINNQMQQNKQQDVLKCSSSSQSTFQTRSISQSQTLNSVNPGISLHLIQHISKIQSLLTNITQIQQKFSIQLLQNQTKIQNQSQLRQYLQILQKRIEDMHYILSNKQNDIVVDHLIDYPDDRMKVKIFRNFQNLCIQMYNLRCMYRKLLELRKQLRLLQNKQQLILQQTYVNQNKLQEHQSPKSTAYQIHSNHYHHTFNKYGKQNQLQLNININIKNKNINENKQKDIYGMNNQFSKQLLQIFKKQLKRQEKLMKQYNNLTEQLTKINKQHQKLVSLYSKSRNKRRNN